MLEPPFNSSAAHLSASKPWLNAIDSCGFRNGQQHCGLTFTTYQTGKLFLVGLKFARGVGTPVSDVDQTLSNFERTYNHRMEISASPDGRRICGLGQSPTSAVPYRAVEETATDGGEMQHLPDGAGRGYDVTCIPRASYTTGPIDVHTWWSMPMAASCSSTRYSAVRQRSGSERTSSRFGVHRC
ncbi:MAG: hypothetical protein NT138_21545 [Planctomycetales bacterium]|nr:hypothetical protein [Planctomycetales bacterium]